MLPIVEETLLPVGAPVASAEPSVAIIVLNWNGRADTLECLASLEQLDYVNRSLIVVDNASDDGSAESIRAAYPHVTVLETGANLGYAGGNNVGLRHACSQGFDYALILNNDTIVDPGLVNALLESQRERPDVAIWGAQIFYYSRPQTVWVARARWNDRTLWFDLPERNAKPLVSPAPLDSDMVIGCCLFVSCANVRRLGELDDRFFLNFEETDWCYRARAAGLGVAVAPGAKLWHKVSSSFGGQTPLWQYFMARNRLLWAEMHLPPATRRRILADSLAMIARNFLPRPRPGPEPWLKRLYWSYRPWREALSEEGLHFELAGYLLGLRDYFLRRFGDCPPVIRRLDQRARARRRAFAAKVA
ncbi:glycosyltransferase family 2 protein [Piscinibacter koreensis]|uniref:Glycosyltransferase family 2 protein n=1 Tax=Piscinibacter koreensis TaxID=2742824 RepID=A0A7Y6NL57_9BURK|nr:glycosyltransferase family 2 protein [Schlegelella koreensis]NUZ05160.1 glycosyltransferase family 2 protein [Schlegelella koreensis]